MKQPINLSPEDFLGALIGRLGKVMHRALTELFRKKGIDLNVDQWIVLVHLWEEDGQNQATLGETAGRNKTSVTRAIDILEHKSLVIRVADKSDRRNNLIYLTHAGRQTIQQVLPHVLSIHDAASQDVSPQQMETCKAVLRIMFNNLKQHI
jgi:DNA-binding MarR family transcriptional regulator